MKIIFTYLFISGLSTLTEELSIRKTEAVSSPFEQYDNLYSINMVNAPDNSTVQCDCGHINCPMCNLLMNLELTEPTWNQN